MFGLALERRQRQKAGQERRNAADDSLIVPQPIEIARFGLANRERSKTILRRALPGPEV
jgi:hypothetical protein